MDITFAAHSDGMTKTALTFDTLFGIDPAKIAITDAVEFLFRSRSWPWPPPPLSPEANKSRSESSIFIMVATEIPRQLCVDVTLECRYRAPLSLHPPALVECGDIGIGSVKTWHGTPDGCVRGGIPLVWGEADSSVEAEDDESDRDSVDTDGRTTTLEAKVVPRMSDLAQVVGACMTASFTELNLYPRKLPMVPTVLIGETSFRVSV